MSDLRWLRPVLGFGLLGVAAMTVLAPAVALLRGTTGHDWYAAPKLTAVEVALAVGFDRHAPVVEYRTRNGSVERTSRRTFYFEGEALGRGCGASSSRHGTMPCRAPAYPRDVWCGRSTTPRWWRIRTTRRSARWSIGWTKTVTRW